jgi:hypothetical protein
MVSVADAPETARRFMNTAMGRMSQDPQLKPLVGHLYGSLAEAVAGLQDQIGLSLPELLAIPQGEVTLAIVAPEQSVPAVVLLVDTGRELPKARKLLERLNARLKEQGAAKAEQTVEGTKFVIHERVGQQARHVIYFEKDATIVIGSDSEVLKQLLAVWNGGPGNTLADRPSFDAVMRRCRGPQDEKPQLTLYVDPIGIMRGVGQENTGVRVAVAVLPALGLDGLRGIGGSVTFDAGQFDSVMHLHLLLDTPRSGVLKMIALESGDSEPERWVPSDVATYTTLHWNIQQTYKELSTLYDSFNGEGAFAQFLQRRFLEPTGIDVEKELLPALEGRVTRVTWIERPVTPQSRASLLALKLNDTNTVGKAIEKLSAGSEGRIVRQTWAGKTYYQVQARLPDDVLPDDVLPDDVLPDDVPPEGSPPQPCFGILDGYLLVADRGSLYQQAVTTLSRGSQSLADRAEFKLIASKIRLQAGGGKPGLVSFSQPEETVRWLYDLATSEQTRQRLSQQAENSRFFRAMDSALQQNRLPPFAVLRRYLAPGGAMATDDRTGLHYMAFTLRRKSD